MKTLMFVVAVLILGGGAYYYFTDRPVAENAIEAPQGEPASVMSFFITSANPGSGGNLGGLDGADAYCTSLAASVGAGEKNWRAYLSTIVSTTSGSVNARDRIGRGPWYNARGEMIAADIEELHGENKLTKDTALNEKGEMVWGRGDEVNMHDILTGSTALGMASSSLSDTTCNNWTSSTTGSAIVGHHDRVGINDSEPMRSWNSSHLSRGCSNDNLKSTGGAGLFYCFVQ